MKRAISMMAIIYAEEKKMKAGKKKRMKMKTEKVKKNDENEKANEIRNRRK